MGFLGIELRGSTSIIFTVGFVIAVDATIHFLSQYSIRKKQGMSVDKAISETISETGKAIYSTTLILLGGFLVLMHSQSWEIYIHGLLVGLILAVAFLADLLLLPVLLRWIEVPREEALPDGVLQPQEVLVSRSSRMK
jgi:predicted RND superfamily exporter protein